MHFNRSRQKAESIADEGEQRSGEAKLVQATSETGSNRARCSTRRPRRWGLDESTTETPFHVETRLCHGNGSASRFAR